MGKRKTTTSFFHNQKSGVLSVAREVVFGVEDGMVSTLGVLIGIAVGTNNHFVVVLSGFVVVLVEAMSMGVGSYLSAKSMRELGERKLKEERAEIKESPGEERKELIKMYANDGWPKSLAEKMAQAASKNKSLFLKEMAYREHNIYPGKTDKPLRGGIYMFFSYIIGGIIPVSSYLFLPVKPAVISSVIATFIGLFALGCATAKFTKRKWWRSGLEMLLVAGSAALVGYAVGTIADNFIS